MKTVIVASLMVVLMILPAAGAMAKVGQGKQPVGNGKLLVPPGLANAEAKIVAAINRQIANENAEFATESAALQDAIDQATLVGDLTQVATLTAELQSLTDEHNARIAALQAKLASQTAAFNAKIAAWEAKHGTTPLPQ